MAQQVSANADDPRAAVRLDHALLQSWLGLPPGSWPPDHYTLLGLMPGRCDPAAVETLVLARMGLLRVHQLLHPELVTEGMNRLAQALICFTDAAARAAYDAELELAAPTPAVSEDENDPLALTLRFRPSPPSGLGFESIPGFPLSTEDGEPPAPDVTQLIEVRFAPGLAPPGEQVHPPQPEQPAYELLDESNAVPAIVEADLFTLPEVTWQPPTRRALFARLAAVRRFLAGWRKLKPILGDPQEPLVRPAGVLALLEAIAEVRPLLGTLSDVVGSSGKPGAQVAVAIDRPLVLPTFRVLLPDQRRAIAIDWRRAELALEREYLRLREVMRSGRPVRRRSRGGWRVWRWALRTPESVLLLAAMVAFVAALIRGVRGR